MPKATPEKMEVTWRGDGGWEGGFGRNGDWERGREESSLLNLMEDGKGRG